MFKVGEIVKVPDLDAFGDGVYGVIEQITQIEGIDVHSVRTLNGAIYSRDDFELSSVEPSEEVDIFRKDVLSLANHHDDLRVAAGLLCGVDAMNA